MHCFTVWGHSIRKRKGTNSELNSSRSCSAEGCVGRQPQHLYVFACSYIQLICHSLLHCFPAGGRICKDMKAHLSGRPQDFLFCQLQNILSWSVTSFLLVALMAITDLFLKLGADISKTAITPLLLLHLLKRKMVLNLGIQLGKARRWAGLPVEERSSFPMVASAFPLSKNALSSGISPQADIGSCCCFYCTAIAWDLVGVWSQTSIVV